MRHTRVITRKPVRAQSAYASKLEFKQDASTLIAINTSGLMADISLIGQALFINALSLGTLMELITGSDDNTQS